MARFTHPDARTRLDPRVKLLAMITAVVAVAALLQRTTLAPLPHGVDGFMGGLAVGLGVSLLIGLLASRG
jgi:hypothetical protein